MAWAYSVQKAGRGRSEKVKVMVSAKLLATAALTDWPVSQHTFKSGWGEEQLARAYLVTSGLVPPDILGHYAFACWPEHPH